MRALLRDAVAAHTTPGAQCAVSRGDNSVDVVCEGALSYDPGAASVTSATVYDLASVTKVFTALLAVTASHRGEVDLFARLDALWPQAAGTAVAACTLDAMLSHRAGLTPWIAAYRETAAEDAGSDGSRDAVLRAVCASPAVPDGRAVYSDLGYILAGEALSHALGAPLDALVRDRVLTPLGEHPGLAYRGVGPRWRDDAVAPTERCAWRGRALRGEVHDENAYALGGVCGHAGIFGDAASLARVGRAVLDVVHGRSDALPRAAITAMLRPRDGGTHRLGWDGRSPEGSSAGALMSAETFGHLGFTGTSLWCDPVRDVAVALVTNRVHPTRENAGIRTLRPRVHDAIIRALP